MAADERIQGGKPSNQTEDGRETRRVPRRALYLGLILAIVVGLVLAILFPPFSSGPPAAGNEAPDFEVVDIDGNTFRLSDHRGQPVLVDWMGVNCPPCRLQMPILVQLHTAYASRGLVMISIDMADFGRGLAAKDEADARAFMEEFGAPWPIALERTGLATRYGVIGIPTLMIVDPQGTIVFMEAGVQSFDELSQTVEPVLQA